MPLLPNKLSFSETGGLKEDYAPITNSATDRSAEEVNNVFATVPALTRTAIRFHARFATDGDGDGYLVNGQSWDSVWKTNTITAPVLAHPSTGIYTITVPTLVLDELLEEHAVNLLLPQASVEDLTTFYNCQAKMTNSNVITVAVFDDTGTLADLVDTIFNVIAL